MAEILLITAPDNWSAIPYCSERRLRLAGNQGACRRPITSRRPPAHGTGWLISFSMALIQMQQPERGHYDPAWTLNVLATLVGALLFSAFHYVGPYAYPLELNSFTFRFLAGLAFSALFMVRGFGIAAWTHALYDVFLVLAGQG